ncbi:MAG: hypothetical protein WEE36_08665 [Acidimicrobiia bacterium]
MGQQPNIPITVADLPRATAKPPAARRWRPDRPGDLVSPEQVPWGGAFGTPGPDTGYALRLLRRRAIEVPAGMRDDVEAALMAIISARSSALGRAPVGPDIDLAIGLLDLPAGAEAVSGIAHDHSRLRRLVEAIPRDVLMGPVGGSGGES